MHIKSTCYDIVEHMLTYKFQLYKDMDFTYLERKLDMGHSITLAF